MTLKEYMAECEMFQNLPGTIIKILAMREYLRFENVLEEWYNEDGNPDFSSVIDMYAEYAKRSREECTNLKPLMEEWWKKNDLWNKNMGEELNDSIRHYYMLEKSDTPLSEVHEFGATEFASLFEDDYVSVPVLGFYDFFNFSNYTHIRFEGISRTKKFPYFISKKRIVKKIKKNKYVIISNIHGFLLRVYGTFVIDGKLWGDRLIELAQIRISEAVRS